MVLTVSSHSACPCHEHCVPCQHQCGQHSQSYNYDQVFVLLGFMKRVRWGGDANMPASLVSLILVLTASVPGISGMRLGSDGRYTRVTVRLSDNIPESQCVGVLTNLKVFLMPKFIGLIGGVGYLLQKIIFGYFLDIIN